MGVTKRYANARRERHFGQTGNQSAIRNIMNDSYLIRQDQASNEVAVTAFKAEINRRRGAVLAAEAFAQLHRGAEFAPGFADQDQGVAGLHGAEVGAVRVVLDQAHGADGGRGRNG